VHIRILIGNGGCIIQVIINSQMGILTCDFDEKSYQRIYTVTKFTRFLSAYIVQSQLIFFIQRNKIKE